MRGYGRVRGVKHVLLPNWWSPPAPESASAPGGAGIGVGSRPEARLRSKQIASHVGRPEERRSHTQTRTTKQQNNKTTNDGYSIGVRYTIVLTADSNEQHGPGR